jgi:hypothetical protein
MSNIILGGGPSGSGSVTLQAPNTNSNQTVNIPDRTGNIMMDGPAVYASATGTQNISNNTYTKIQFNTETFDTNSCFDNSTNYRFTPNVAGYYLVTISYDSGASSAITSVWGAIYKNGTLYGAVANQSNLANAGVGGYVNALVYCNGSTDYIEGYQLTNTSSQGRINGNVFYAYMVRAA